MGHQGAERTLSLICDRFFWPYMQSDVEHYVTRVCTCLKQKKPCRDTRAPLANIVTTHPFELAYNMPVRIKQASTSKSGKTDANLIFNDFALKFGFPSCIHHDQGEEFENQLFSQL